MSPCRQYHGVWDTVVLTNEDIMQFDVIKKRYKDINYSPSPTGTA